MRAVFKGRHSTGQGGIRRAVGQEDSLRADTRLWLQDEEELHRPRLEGKGQRAHCQRKSCQNRLEGQTQGMPTVERLVPASGLSQTTNLKPMEQAGIQNCFYQLGVAMHNFFPPALWRQKQRQGDLLEFKDSQGCKEGPRLKLPLPPPHQKRETVSKQKRIFTNVFNTWGQAKELAQQLRTLAVLSGGGAGL